MRTEHNTANRVDTRADDLLRELALLRQIAQRREALRQRIAAYEDRYQIRSDDIHTAIDSGRLTETEEVCDWIMEYELLQRTAP